MISINLTLEDSSIDFPSKPKEVLAFSILRFWLFIRSVFRFFFCQETSVFSVLVFIVVCGFSVFQHLVLRFVKKHWWVFGFGIWCGFRFSYSRFLLDLSGNKAPLLISSSRENLCLLHLSLTVSDRFGFHLTGMWKFIGFDDFAYAFRF